ncbi:MAG: CvpA family protein, partial [Sedimentisphaerales bacterium]|nr:CvpA family protein [Sedimentisphaerales bacterium]
MVFWIAILIGVLFAWLGVRLGFYETWILCFNVIVSIYVAIFLAPLVVDFAPGTGQAAVYCTALSLIVLAGGCFAILQGTAYVCLTGQFNIPFPRVFDILFSGLLGFVAGFLVLSFVAIVLTTTPLAEHSIVGTIGFTAEAQSPNIACLARGCDLIHAFAGSASSGRTPEEAVHLLLTARRENDPNSAGERADANKPPPSPATA